MDKLNKREQFETYAMALEALQEVETPNKKQRVAMTFLRFAIATIKEELKNV